MMRLDAFCVPPADRSILLGGHQRRCGNDRVLTTVLVPAGMGYPEAARLPAITGLPAPIALLIGIGLLSTVSR